MSINLNLISKCIDGDRNAQRIFYEQNYQWLMSICYRYHSNYEDAVSTLNKGFLKIMNSLPTFDASKKIEPWMKVIMVNTALDELRAHKSYRKKMLLVDENDWEIHNNSNYNESSIVNIDLEEYWSLFEALPEPDKTVFNLFAIDGYSHKEISEKLEISERTSKRYLNRARGWLGEKLKNKEKIEKGA